MDDMACLRVWIVVSGLPFIVAGAVCQAAAGEWVGVIVLPVYLWLVGAELEAGEAGLNWPPPPPALLAKPPPEAPSVPEAGAPLPATVATATPPTGLLELDELEWTAWAAAAETAETAAAAAADA